MFSDRAEVTRLIETKLNAGTVELRLIGLPLKIDENTVRVAGGVGTHRVTILEVMVLPLQDEESEVLSEEQKEENKKAIIELQMQLKDLKIEQTRIDYQRR